MKRKKQNISAASVHDVGESDVKEPVESSFSESSETESQRDVGVDFVGFKKTRDFGDFVTFSNSPSHL